MGLMMSHLPLPPYLLISVSTLADNTTVHNVITDH